MAKLFTLYGWLSAFFLIALLSAGCDKVVRYEVNTNELQKIYSSSIKPSQTLNKNVDLFVDYSTCVKDAVSNSVFFASIRPRITGIKPITLYSIKGKVIDTFSSNNDSINLELNKITEILYANIELAVERICNSNNQSILITDGEYWTKPEGERTDLPYMKQPFIKWLNKGFSIHVISETYEEKSSVKKRFYFFFTDDKLKDNIYSEVSKAENFNSPGVSFFTLTNSDATIIRNVNTVDDQLEFTVDTSGKFDFVKIDSPWKDIKEFVQYVQDDEEESEKENEHGTSHNGHHLFKDIKIRSKELANFKIEDIDIKAYSYTDVYLDSIHSNNLVKEIPKGFILDNETFKKAGDISIKISDDLGQFLETDKENLIRLDIVLKEIKLKPVPTDLFTWKSINKPTDNVSVYESVKQALDNPDTNPMKQNNGIIYTVFIKTAEYK